MSFLKIAKKYGHHVHRHFFPSLSKKMVPNRKTDQRRVNSEKIHVKPIALAYPAPIVLCGTLVDDKANFATLGACGVIALNPPVLYVSLQEGHLTAKGISEKGVFSINVPDTRLLVETDYCGIVSGRQHDKSTIFDLFFGNLENAPMVRQCPVNMVCRVEQEIRIHGRAVYIGEVIEVYANAQCVDKKGRLKSLTEISPLVYGREGQYYTIGRSVGRAYQVGRNYR